MSRFNVEKMTKVTTEINKAMLKATVKHFDEITSDEMIMANFVAFKIWFDDVIQSDDGKKDMLEFLGILTHLTVEWMMAKEGDDDE